MKTVISVVTLILSSQAFASSAYQLECKDYSFFYSLITKKVVRLQDNPLNVPSSWENTKESLNVLAENETHQLVIARFKHSFSVVLFKKLSSTTNEVRSMATYPLVDRSKIQIDFNADQIQARLNCTLKKRL